MKDLPIHLALFALIGGGIVVLSTLYAEPEDAKAWRALPRRLRTFFVGCAVLTAVMLACERVFASIH